MTVVLRPVPFILCFLLPSGTGLRVPVGGRFRPRHEQCSLRPGLLFNPDSQVASCFLLKNGGFFLAVACVINVCTGSIYAWSVFAPALADRLTSLTGETVTAGMLAVAFSLANAVGPVPMILGGWLNDRFGPRAVIPAGGLLLGLGLLLAGIAESPTALIFGYGICFGLGLGLVYSASVGTVLKYFPDKRGLAGGIATAAYGMSSVIVPPAAVFLITGFGIERAMMTLAAVFALLIVTGGLVLQKCPEGFTAGSSSAPRAGSGVPQGCDWRGMLRSRRFLPMMVLMLCGAVPAIMIISHGFSVAKSAAGLDAAKASAVVSLLALMNVLGRVLAGAVSDRFGRPATLAAALVFTGIGLVLLAVSDAATVPVFCAGIVCIGLSFGAFMGIYPGFTAEEFGSRHNSVNYGIMFCGFSATGFAGPLAMGTLLGAGMSFATICLGSLTLVLAGLAAVFWFMRVK